MVGILRVLTEHREETTATVVCVNAGAHATLSI